MKNLNSKTLEEKAVKRFMLVHCFSALFFNLYVAHSRLGIHQGSEGGHVKIILIKFKSLILMMWIFFTMLAFRANFCKLPSLSLLLFIDKYRYLPLYTTCLPFICNNTHLMKSYKLRYGGKIYALLKKYVRNLTKKVLRG